MKRTYEEAELNILIMNGEDVIVTSPGNGTPIKDIDLVEDEI